MIDEIVKPCKFCGSDYYDDLDGEQGFWCADCDSYNYFDEQNETRRFTLILESRSPIDNARASVKVKLNKRLSPLRYPGGKSKIADYLYHRLNLAKAKVLVSPYSGGGSVELALLHAGVIDYLILNDFDYGVYALFETIRSDPEALIERIENIKLTHADYFKAQAVVLSGYEGCNLLEAAWSMLLNNRLAFSGIYNAKPLGGKEGETDKLLSRWIPDALVKRIEIIHSLREKFEIRNVDACELIEEAYWMPETTILIDPPYYKQGKRLYRCFYKEQDHVNLNVLLESLYTGFPGADILLCYDDEEFIERLYWFPQVEKISRAFSA